MSFLEQQVRARVEPMGWAFREPAAVPHLQPPPQHISPSPTPAATRDQHRLMHSLDKFHGDKWKTKQFVLKEPPRLIWQLREEEWGSARTWQLKEPNTGHQYAQLKS